MRHVEYNNHWYKQEKPGWYEYTLDRHLGDSVAWMRFYVVVVEWINTNIDGAYKHTRWKLNPETATFKFRHERDFLLFILKWS